MTDLLDANVLIALVASALEHHEVAVAWLRRNEHVAVHPIVEGALVRLLIRMGESAAVAQRLASEVRAAPATDVRPDGPSYADVDLTGVIGHRQVTDVYLAAVASAHGGRLVTLDESLARLRPAGTVLIGAA